MTHVPTQIQTREIAAQFRYRPLQATGIHANTKLVNIQKSHDTYKAL